MFEQEQQNTPEMQTEANTTANVVSITEAARINNVTRQAIYVAIKQKKLRASKDATRWTIDLNDLEEYRRKKYSRAKSMFDGELVFDNHKGYFSVNQVAKMLGVPPQKIYYATRIGLMKAIRKGAAWVIHSDDIKNYQENYLNKRTVNTETSNEAM
ncbi:MAG: EUO transcription factor [Chlamydiia bacterium]|nr:EUO transcription factor [Chlamydiia bacterium]MCH9618409.1 EUO transcription factor [Chlamydiia bacterium]MCH9623735.1 EUO transcription factor [Chlamydiia bacterium]